MYLTLDILKKVFIELQSYYEQNEFVSLFNIDSLPVSQEPNSQKSVEALDQTSIETTQIVHIQTDRNNLNIIGKVINKTLKMRFHDFVWYVSDSCLMACKLEVYSLHRCTMHCT